MLYNSLTVLLLNNPCLLIAMEVATLGELVCALDPLVRTVWEVSKARAPLKAYTLLINTNYVLIQKSHL